MSITVLAERYPEHLRHRFFGVHMFNPPYSLNLCELTPTQYSDMTLCDDLSEYLRDVLFRTVVKVEDSSAFLGIRIGFQFINEVLQYAEKYKYSGGIDYMDAVLGPFSGRSMAPLVTADFVGLDIHLYEGVLPMLSELRRKIPAWDYHRRKTGRSACKDKGTRLGTVYRSHHYHG